MSHTVLDDSVAPLGKLPVPRLSLRIFGLAVMAGAAVFALGWYLTSVPVVNLGVGDNMSDSSLHASWLHGGVVVMIRHAERCDRSINPCLGSADGITVKGSHAASRVGTGLQRLGLHEAQLIASPATRTRQTANLVAGRTVPTQEWVSDCDKGFTDAVIRHKKPQQNLVLITHSGCIDQFERSMGVRAGMRSSDYAEAVFVRIDGLHPPRIIGSLDAKQWNDLGTEAWN